MCVFLVKNIFYQRDNFNTEYIIITIKSIIDPMFYYTDLIIELLLSDFNHYVLHNSLYTWIFCKPI